MLSWFTHLPGISNPTTPKDFYETETCHSSILGILTSDRGDSLQDMPMCSREVAHTCATSGGTYVLFAPGARGTEFEHVWSRLSLNRWPVYDRLSLFGYCVPEQCDGQDERTLSWWYFLTWVLGSPGKAALPPVPDGLKVVARLRSATAIEANIATLPPGGNCWTSSVISTGFPALKSNGVPWWWKSHITKIGPTHFEGKSWPRLAYVTFMATVDFFTGVMVLRESLRMVGARYPLIVLVGPKALSVSELLEDGQTIIVSTAEEEERVLPATHRTYLSQLRNKFPTDAGVSCLQKLSIFGLTGLSKAMYLDGDTLVLRNIDKVFNDAPNFAAVPTMSGLCTPCSLLMNSGVMVVRPGKKIRLDALLEAKMIVEEHGVTTLWGFGNDQLILNRLVGSIDVPWVNNETLRLPLGMNKWAHQLGPLDKMFYRCSQTHEGKVCIHGQFGFGNPDSTDFTNRPLIAEMPFPQPFFPNSEISKSSEVTVLHYSIKPWKLFDKKQRDVLANMKAFDTWSWHTDLAYKVWHGVIAYVDSRLMQEYRRYRGMQAHLGRVDLQAMGVLCDNQCPDGVPSMPHIVPAHLCNMCDITSDFATLSVPVSFVEWYRYLDQIAAIMQQR